MSVNKAIRWGYLPSGRLICVWRFSYFIHLQPADLLWGACIGWCQGLVCCRAYLSTAMSSATTCWASKPFACTVPPSRGESLHFKSLIFQSDCTNISGKRWGGSTLQIWTNTQTPGVLRGYHYGSTVCTCPARMKTKQDTLGDLIRRTLLHRLSAALSHSPLFLSMIKSALMFGGVFLFLFSFFLACSHWSAVLEDSCCDCRAQLNLKLLI